MSKFLKFSRTLMFLVAVAVSGTFNQANAQTLEVEVTGEFMFTVGGAADPVGLDGESFTWTFVFDDTTTATSPAPGVTSFATTSSTLEVVGEILSASGPTQFAFLGGNALISAGGQPTYTFANGSVFLPNPSIASFVNVTAPSIGDVISTSFLDGGSISSSVTAFQIEAGAPDAFFSIVNSSITVTASAIPEPGSFTVLGLLGLVALRRKR